MIRTLFKLAFCVLNSVMAALNWILGQKSKQIKANKEQQKVSYIMFSNL